VLALAPPHGRFLRDLEFHRLQAGALVGAVAEGLMGRATAGTPPVDTRFDFESEGLSIANNRFFRHRDTLTGRSAAGNDGNAGELYLAFATSAGFSPSSEINGSFGVGGVSFFAESGTEPRPRLG